MLDLRSCLPPVAAPFSIAATAPAFAACEFSAEDAVVSIVTVTRSYAPGLDAATERDEERPREVAAVPVADNEALLFDACRTLPSEKAVRLPAIPAMAKSAVNMDVGGSALSKRMKLTSPNGGGAYFYSYFALIHSVMCHSQVRRVLPKLCWNIDILDVHPRVNVRC